MFKRVDRIIDALEELVRLFRIFVEEYIDSHIPTDDELEEALEPGLYRVTQEAHDEYERERHNRRYAEMDNPYREVHL